MRALPCGGNDRMAGRVLLIGAILQIVLQHFAKGLVPERPPRMIDDKAESR